VFPNKQDVRDVKVMCEMWTSFAIPLKLHYFAKQMFVANYTTYVHTKSIKVYRDGHRSDVFRASSV